MLRKLLVILFALWSVQAGAADKYWCSGSANWDGTAGLKWATDPGCVTGLGAAIPTSADDVYIGSGAPLGTTITIATGNTGARSLFLHDGLGGAFTGTLAGGTTAIALSGGITLNGIITHTGTITFNATSGTHTITSNGISFLESLTFNGVGGTWVLADALTIPATKTLTLTNGAFLNSGNFAVSVGLMSGTGAAVRTFNGGDTTATWTLTGAGTVWAWSTITNLTWAGSPNLIVTNASASAKTLNFANAVNDVTITGAGTGGYTYAAETGTTCRDFLVQNTGGSTHTVAVSAGSMTCRHANFAGSTNNVWSGTGTLALTGNLTLAAGLTMSQSTAWRFNGTSGTQTLTSATIPFSGGITVNAPGATVALADALTLGGILTHTAGSLTLGGFAVQSTTYVASNSNTRALTCGASTYTLTAAGTPWSLATSTGMTMSCASGTIEFTDASASSKTFAGGGLTYGGLYLGAAGGTGSFIITGANTFGSLSDDNPPSTIVFPASTTTTVGSFGVFGEPGNLTTIGSSSATLNATLSLSSGTVSTDYLRISFLTAAQGGTIWNAGENSTDNGNNGGWFFPLTNRKALGMAGAGF